ncbi:hypothetical protein HHI36_007560, partial [Cryptolaemus montrouzieri]
MSGDRDDSSPGSMEKRRVFSDLSMETFVASVEEESWEDVFCSNDVDVSYEMFHNLFHHHFDNHFPVKRVRSSSVSDSWVSDEVRQSSKNLLDLHLMRRVNPDLQASCADLGFFQGFRLLCFVQTGGLFSEGQHGFRAGKSTASSTGCFYDKILRFME